MVGAVKFFSLERGFGFIAPDGGGEDVFVHVRALQRSGLHNLTQCDRVEFEIQPSRSKAGKTEACDVRMLGRAVRFGEWFDR